MPVCVRKPKQICGFWFFFRQKEQTTPPCIVNSITSTVQVVWYGQARITAILKTSDKNLDDIFRFLYVKLAYLSGFSGLYAPAVAKTIKKKGKKKITNL